MTDGSKQITENPTASEIPTTAGMTTKVVKGSMWTLAGQIAPLAVSLFTTPFTIRLLGAEGYGVLILIGLIPTYLGFADFGMSLASTKFGSEAYAENNPEKEARIIRTAALIALISSVPIAAGLMIFARQIIELFNVPPNLQPEAVTALRIAAVTFVINFLCGIFNTPQLARLRMDLNTFINAGTRILGLIATPIAIYLGFGIVGAVTVLLTASLLQLAGQIFFSRRLLPALIGFTVDRKTMRPLARYGGPLVIGSIAGLILANGEKGILGYTVNSSELAYYSLAFTLANTITFFSGSITQSLLPAFSRLSLIKYRNELKSLYFRMIRVSLMITIPLIIGISVISEPFLRIWAGEEFERNSSVPFYLLLLGLTVNIMAYFPHATLLALGQSQTIAKIYWIEIVPYTFATYYLSLNFGANGAASAWAIRVIVDAILLFGICYKKLELKFELKYLVSIVAFVLLIWTPAALLIFKVDRTLVSFLAIIIAVFLFFIIYNFFVTKSEKQWLLSKSAGFMFSLRSLSQRFKVSIL